MTDAILNIPVAKIHTGRNPRKTFNEATLKELAGSIKEHGVIEPILVEPDDGKGYILVAGERRLRATQMAGLPTIRAIVQGRSNHNGRERFVLSIVENDQRENMNAMDRAEAYQVLRIEYEMSVRDISRKVGKAEIVVRNFLRLNDLDEPIRELIRNGWMKDVRLANALLAIPEAETRIGLATRLYTNKVSLKGCLKACARTLEALAVQKPKAGRPSMGKTPSLSLAAQQSGVEAGESAAPPHWNMLKQIGAVPAWSEVIVSAAETCADCPLRDIASPANCRDCGAVVLLQTLMERAQ